MRGTAPAPGATTAAAGTSSRASSGSPSRRCSCSCASGPAHGYDLLERLPELTGEQRVEMGNLYRLLRALEEEGLVASEWDATPPGRQAPLRAHRARARSCSTSGPRRCAARRSAPQRFLERYEERR